MLAYQEGMDRLQGKGLSTILRLMHPGCYVALTMQDAPNVDVVVALDVEDQVRIAFQWPKAQARQIKLVGAPGRARWRVAGDVRIGLLQGVNESERGLSRVLTQVIRDGLIDILVGPLTWNDCLDLHARAWDFTSDATRLRSESK